MFSVIGSSHVATCVKQLESLGEPSYFAEHLLDLGRLTYSPAGLSLASLYP